VVIYTSLFESYREHDYISQFIVSELDKKYCHPSVFITYYVYVLLYYNIGGS
jgi:hypothetical protein